MDAATSTSRQLATVATTQKRCSDVAGAVADSDSNSDVVFVAVTVTVTVTGSEAKAVTVVA